MSKKIFIVLLALVVMVGPLFAAGTAVGGAKDGTTDLKLDLSFIQRAVTIAVGFVGGAYSLWKLGAGLVGALKDQDHDQGAIKRVVGTFIFNAILLSGFLFLVNYVGKADATTTATVDSFFSGLTGAFVSL